MAMFAAVFFSVSSSVFMTFESVVNVSLWLLTCDCSSRNSMFWSSLASSDDSMFEVLGFTLPEAADEVEDVPFAAADEEAEAWESFLARTCSAKDFAALRSGAGMREAGREADDVEAGVEWTIMARLLDRDGPERGRLPTYRSRVG
jgi:hypothetical protein